MKKLLASLLLICTANTANADEYEDLRDLVMMLVAASEVSSRDGRETGYYYLEELSRCVFVKHAHTTIKSIDKESGKAKYTVSESRVLFALQTLKSDGETSKLETIDGEKTIPVQVSKHRADGTTTRWARTHQSWPIAIGFGNGPHIKRLVDHCRTYYNDRFNVEVSK